MLMQFEVTALTIRRRNETTRNCFTACTFNRSTLRDHDRQRNYSVNRRTKVFCVVFLALEINITEQGCGKKSNSAHTSMQGGGGPRCSRWEAGKGDAREKNTREALRRVSKEKTATERSAVLKMASPAPSTSAASSEEGMKFKSAHEDRGGASAGEKDESDDDYSSIASDGFVAEIESAFSDTSSSGSATGGSLMDLHTELLMKICALLGPSDLTQLACVNRTLRSVASLPELWKRAYRSRFGDPSEAERTSSSSWKSLYMHIDAVRMQAAMDDANEEMRVSLQDMVRCARSAAPSPSERSILHDCDDDEEEDDDDAHLRSTQVHEMCAHAAHFQRRSSYSGLGASTPASTSTASQPQGLANESPKRKRQKTRAAQNAWRSRRGLGPPPSDNEHICSIATCTFERVGDTLLCERTGKEHTCSARKCKEKEFDPSRGEYVCKITGRVFQCMDVLDTAAPVVREHEEAAFSGADEGELVLRGRLGASYEAGYGCCNEYELLKYLRGRC